MTKPKAGAELDVSNVKEVKKNAKRKDTPEGKENEKPKGKKGSQTARTPSGQPKVNSIKAPAMVQPLSSVKSLSLKSASTRSVSVKSMEMTNHVETKAKPKLTTEEKHELRKKAKEMKKQERAEAVVQSIEQHGYTAVVRAYESTTVAKIIDQYVKGGLKVIEVTTSCPGYAKAIKELRTKKPDVLVGVGQCLTVLQCKTAISAGAQFVVSPVFDEAVVKEAIKRNTPMMPGCATPGEMKRAQQIAPKLCSIQKLFPETKLPVVLQSVGKSGAVCDCADKTSDAVSPAGGTVMVAQPGGESSEASAAASKSKRKAKVTRPKATHERADSVHSSFAEE